MSLKPLLSEVFDFFSFALDAGEKPVFSFAVSAVIDRAQQIGMNEIVHASSPLLSDSGDVNYCFLSTTPFRITSKPMYFTDF